MTVQIGILSAAHPHAGAYVKCLSNLECATLVGVAGDHRNRDAIRKFAETHGTTVYTPDELLERVDGALVCSANATHQKWIECAATAGVDVLCEKPLAPATEEARDVVATCDAAGVALGVAMPLRFSSPVQRVKDLVDQGSLGTLRFLSGANRGKVPTGWFVNEELAGGGAVVDHTVHILDIVRWITDEEVREVYAEIDTSFHDSSVEDCNLLSMELSDGTTFVLDGSWSRPDEWDRWGDATLRIVGTAGVVSVDCFGKTIKQTRNTGDSGIHSIDYGVDPNEALISDFVESIRDGRPPSKTGQSAVHDVKVIEAAYESAERGESVTIDRGT